MRVIGSILAMWIAALVQVQAEDAAFQSEGILGSRCVSIESVSSLALAFLPYNPVVVETKAYVGERTLQLAKTYPYGHIFAFEPHPEPYNQLVEKTRFLNSVSAIPLAINTFNGSSQLWGEGPYASVFNRGTMASEVTVSCVVLDDWCHDQGITHVDFLRMDAGGMEWQIIQSSPRILKSVLVLLTKTYLSSDAEGIILFPTLKSLLEAQGFTLLAHCYKGGKEGEAIFVRKHLYDSIFN